MLKMISKKCYLWDRTNESQGIGLSKDTLDVDEILQTCTFLLYLAAVPCLQIPHFTVLTGLA